MVVIPQADDRLAVDLVVVAQEWMAARQDPGDERETTVELTRHGVDHMTESPEDADRPGMVHSVGGQEMHQDHQAVAIVVMGTGALNNAVRMTAVLKIVALKAVAPMIAVMVNVE